jgi:hypothetical protein
MNQTAHISLQIPSISKSVAPVKPEPRDKNQPDALPFPLARPADKPLFCNQTLLQSVSCDPVVRAVWRPVVRLSAAGEVGSKVTDRQPQALFSRNLHFFRKSRFFLRKRYVAQSMATKSSFLRNNVCV